MRERDRDRQRSWDSLKTKTNARCQWKAGAPQRGKLRLCVEKLRKAAAATPPLLLSPFSGYVCVCGNRQA